MEEAVGWRPEFAPVSTASSTGKTTYTKDSKNEDPAAPEVIFIDEEDIPPPYKSHRQIRKSKARIQKEEARERRHQEKMELQERALEATKKLQEQMEEAVEWRPEFAPVSTASSTGKATYTKDSKNYHHPAAPEVPGSNEEGIPPPYKRRKHISKSEARVQREEARERRHQEKMKMQERALEAIKKLQEVFTQSLRK